MSQLFQISTNDFRLVFREPALRTFLVMPVAILAIVYFFLPWLAQQYPAMTPYLPILMMGASTQASTMYGFIYSIVFLEEKDQNVAKIYTVLPMNRVQFLIGRMAIPWFLSVGTTFVIWITQPFFDLSVLQYLGISVFFAMIFPIMAFIVGGLARNKLEGMNWYKILNLIVSLPLAAFFVGNWADAFGLLPHYWGFKAIEQFTMGENGWLSLAIGIPILVGILGLLVRWFAKRHYENG